MAIKIKYEKTEKGHGKKHEAKETKTQEKKEHSKVSKVMTEWKSGKLHSGSKKGPVVTNRKQAIAIGLSEARKAGQKVKKAK